MRRLLLYYLKRKTGELPVNTIRGQIRVLYKKFKHHHYHSDWLIYGKYVFFLILIFLVIFYSLRYYSDKVNLENKMGFKDTTIEDKLQ